MRMRFLAATAMSIALATAAYAQSPTNAPSKSNDKSTTQNQPSTTSPSSTSTQNTGASTNSNQSAGSNAPANTNTSQAPAASGTSNQAQSPPASGSPSQQSANPPPPSTNQAQQAPANTGNQAQQPQAAPGNQAQQAPSNTGTTAQQPGGANNRAQSPSANTNVTAQININDRQRTRINQSVAKLNVRPLTNVNFSLSVGTVVSRDVHLSTLPADVVEIVPQYRGYSFVLVRDEIAIVDPATYKIVTVLPYSGKSTASAPPRERSKVSYTERDRDVVRKHAKSHSEHRSEGRTTGSSVRTDIRVGERVPDTVEIESFPDEVYRDAPTLREYRYIRRDSRTYMVDPRERTIIEEID